MRRTSAAMSTPAAGTSSSRGAAESGSIGAGRCGRSASAKARLSAASTAMRSRALTLPPSRIVLKRMSSQWGSLSSDGAMALDLSLVLARPSAFEYVLVHELCHLIRADHSPAFWREVETRFPAWRDERRYFHREGRQLKANLRALTSACTPGLR